MNLLNKIFRLNYWQEYREYRKVKSVLSEFFNHEDNELQNAFIKNFDYPEDMVNPPVRFEENSGDIYYTINFKSKELFENTGTKEQAYTNSLALLDKCLPLGIVNYIIPNETIHLPDTFTILCSFKIDTEVSQARTIKNVLLTFITPASILSFIGLIVKYFLF